MDKIGKITAVGHIALDYIFNVDKFPELNTSMQIPTAKKYYGGAACNVAAEIANLGLNSEILSCVGTDFKASGYGEYLEKLGVSTKSVFVSEEEETPKAWIFTDPQNNQITYFLWGAAKHYPEIEVPEFDSEIVHLATGDPNYNLKCAQKASSKGILVSFDPGQDLTLYSKENMENIIENVDFLFMNNHEFQRTLDLLNISEKELISRVKVLIVTYGKQGSIIYSEDDAIKVPAVLTQAKDPTGAGDSYRAGFLTAYLKGHDLKNCGLAGSCVASFVVEQVGCQTNLPSWEMVIERLNENNLL
ncbi:carbohydrate kinase family protein [Methanococcus maripaludis]|jgi:ribokinase|uniref:Carbohydrate kinase family protein n=3 Tax=Methanococcus maripaludis TaxID=39152 RepID=A0A8T3W7S8_METMI|nr:carbohydrate kinase family protein [Methanococcus maripaludis]AEK19315.1 carbohydrate kinase PfkB [Methanococcus maripaludis X1]MBG0769622.1 carbohydrate kinase family protein [Methanococcus maripaludis]MDK2929366.1 nucleoside kinase [Methanococcus sp.]BAP60554.1 putative carbohydrate kinase [Methanococcus maripaludis KA1]